MGDKNAFRDLLHEMLTSRKPTTEALLCMPFQPLRGKPRRRAGGCAPGRALHHRRRNAPSMQKILTELRC